MIVQKHHYYYYNHPEQRITSQTKLHSANGTTRNSTASGNWYENAHLRDLVVYNATITGVMWGASVKYCYHRALNRIQQLLAASPP